MRVVAEKDGRGIDGIKLSTHDVGIGSPSIAVAPDGMIHVAFVEKHKTRLTNAIYHRSSSDGGKTWTEAKNLSEEMADIDVGRCQVLVDAKNRAYVVWRAALGLNFVVSADAAAGGYSNLYYRALEGGKWSRIKLITELAAPANQNDGAISFFTTLDPAGKAQVLWNVLPDKWHPESWPKRRMRTT